MEWAAEEDKKNIEKEKLKKQDEKSLDYILRENKNLS